MNLLLDYADSIPAMGIGACLLAIVAAWLVMLNWVRLWLVKTVRNRLARRHVRVCGALNELWRGRCVRDAATGRVGICVSDCTQNHAGGWRELIAPRWVADVVTDPELAALQRAPLEVRSIFDMIRRGELIHRLMDRPGAVVRWPVAGMTLAPSGEAAAFREAMVVPSEEGEEQEHEDGGEA